MSLLATLGLLATSITGVPTTDQTPKAADSLTAIEPNASTDADTEWRRQAEIYAQPGSARVELIKKLGERILDNLLAMENKNSTIAIHTALPPQKGKTDEGGVQERDESTLVKRVISFDKFLWCTRHIDDGSCPWGLRYNFFLENAG